MATPARLGLVLYRQLMRLALSIDRQPAAKSLLVAIPDVLWDRSKDSLLHVPRPPDDESAAALLGTRPLRPPTKHVPQLHRAQFAGSSHRPHFCPPPDKHIFAFNGGEHYLPHDPPRSVACGTMMDERMAMPFFRLLPVLHSLFSMAAQTH